VSAEPADVSDPSAISVADAATKSEPRRHALPLPSEFFDVHVHDISQSVPLLGLCAGFESGSWRAKGLASHLMNYLIEFALTRDEWQGTNAVSAFRHLRRAARMVYATDKYEHRGEVGELLLHAVMRQYYGSYPMVSKFYFKSAANDTVKGFDAAHLTFGNSSSGIELWLGEAKLYSDIDLAIRDVCDELRKHLSDDFLRSEFMWLENKLPVSLPEIEEVRRLLNEATSLDEIFDVLHVPILLTYDSDTLRDHSRTDPVYVEKFKSEISKYHDKFCLF
jgi:hypothetical protein